MTLQKIADITGVSVSTVSKAFSDSSEISADTKSLIFKTAHENGCFEKYYKGKYKKKVVAVICPEIIGDYYNSLVTDLEKLINEMGAVMVVSVSNFSETRERELFEYYSFVQKADAIIIVESHEKTYPKSDIPVILIGGQKSNISVDIENIMDNAVKHLKLNGHKHIAFAGEFFTRAKGEFFKKTLIKNSLNFQKDFLFESTNRFEKAGSDCAKKLLLLKNRPTAVICAYDNIAIGLIKELKRNGLNVPADISVIGINDIPSVSYCEIELTSVRIDTHDLCCAAIEILKKIFKNQYKISHHVSIDGKLVKRNSVKNIKGIA